MTVTVFVPMFRAMFAIDQLVVPETEQVAPVEDEQVTEVTPTLSLAVPDKVMEEEVVV